MTIESDARLTTGDGLESGAISWLRRRGFDVRVSVVHGPLEGRCSYAVEMMAPGGEVVRSSGENFPGILRELTGTAFERHLRAATNPPENSE